MNEKDAVIEKVVPAEEVKVAEEAVEAVASEPAKADVFRLTFRHVQRVKDKKGVVINTIIRSDEHTAYATGVDAQDAAKKVHAVFGEDIEFSGGGAALTGVLV